MSDDVFKYGLGGREYLDEANIIWIDKTPILSPEQVEQLYQAFKARLAQEAAVNLFPNDGGDK